MVLLLEKYVELKIIMKFVTWLNPIKHLKNYLNTIIDERVKSIITSEKLDNIVHQITLEDVDYLEYLKMPSSNTEKINFADKRFIKLKQLGLINESLDYNASNDNLNRLVENLQKRDILVAYITFTEMCNEVCNLVKSIQGKSIDENNKNANDLTKSRATAIKKFSDK